MKLILLPRNQNKQTCELYPEQTGDPAGMNLELTAQTAQVYYDVYYDLEIQWDGQMPDRFFVSINGDLKSGYPESTGPLSAIFHCSSSNGEYNLFSDCYGFVRVEVESFFRNGSDEERSFCYSDYLEVMIRQDRLSSSLSRMFEYIGRQHRRFLQTDAARPAPSIDVAERRDRTFERQITLLNQIRNVYEHYLPFFKANPHLVIDSAYEVRDFERLRQIDPSTVDYIVRHPDLLIPTDLPYGIEYEGQKYLPSQTLVLETRQSRDCYENAVVMGFFETVLDGIETLRKKIGGYVASIERVTRTQGSYTSSADVIIRLFREQLLSYINKLDLIQSGMQKLYWTYKNFLPVRSARLDRLPKLTPVFLSVGAYRQIYEMIMQWFDFGSYSFRSEEFMLPFMVNSSVYEYYVLFKFAEALENNGFVYQPAESQCFSYVIPDKRIRPLRHTNTFLFRDSGGSSAVLYFQPVISGSDYSETRNNGINLRRTTTHGLKARSVFPGFRRGFYNPDYILKIKTGSKEKYLIADAKFKPFTFEEIPDLAYKYAFSVQPALPESELAGVAVFYGKTFGDKAELRDLFDLFSNDRFPKFWFTSLTESEVCTADSQTQMFGQLIRKLM